jgi:hypothetical protein
MVAAIATLIETFGRRKQLNFGVSFRESRTIARRRLGGEPMVAWPPGQARTA